MCEYEKHCFVISRSAVRVRVGAPAKSMTYLDFLVSQGSPCHHYVTKLTEIRAIGFELSKPSFWQRIRHNPDGPETAHALKFNLDRLIGADHA